MDEGIGKSKKERKDAVFCTQLRAQNGANVSSWLHQHPDFVARRDKIKWNEPAKFTKEEWEDLWLQAAKNTAEEIKLADYEPPIKALYFYNARATWLLRQAGLSPLGSDDLFSKTIRDFWQWGKNDLQNFSEHLAGRIYLRLHRVFWAMNSERMRQHKFEEVFKTAVATLEEQHREYGWVVSAEYFLLRSFVEWEQREAMLRFVSNTQNYQSLTTYAKSLAADSIFAEDAVSMVTRNMTQPPKALRYIVEMEAYAKRAIRNAIVPIQESEQKRQSKTVRLPLNPAETRVFSEKEIKERIEQLTPTAKLQLTRYYATVRWSQDVKTQVERWKIELAASKTPKLASPARQQTARTMVEKAIHIEQQALDLLESKRLDTELQLRHAMDKLETTSEPEAQKTLQANIKDYQKSLQKALPKEMAIQRERIEAKKNYLDQIGEQAEQFATQLLENAKVSEEAHYFVLLHEAPQWDKQADKSSELFLRLLPDNPKLTKEHRTINAAQTALKKLRSKLDQQPIPHHECGQ